MATPTPVRVACLFAAAFCVSTAAQADDYPCGSDSMPPALKKLIPQEFHGADFRPACRRHDACYDTPGANKRACDKQFLRDLRGSCDCSDHPVMCRFVGRLFYASVKLGGRSAFNDAQGK